MKPYWRDLLGDCLGIVAGVAAGAALFWLGLKLAMGAPLVLVVDGDTICHASSVRYQTNTREVVVNCSPIVYKDGFEDGSGAFQ